jgi:hypothetical protein
MSGPWLFASFFLGGFGCLDIVDATQHDKLAREDYRLCRSAGIHAVREAASTDHRSCDRRLPS